MIDLELKSGIDIKLVTQNPKCKMLTVENYMKWYDVYIVDVTKKVEAVAQGHRNDTVSNMLHEYWFDHCISPVGFLLVAKELGAKVDKESFTAVVEMFIDNYYTFENTIDTKHMPSEELKLAIIIQGCD